MSEDTWKPGRLNAAGAALRKYSWPIGQITWAKKDGMNRVSHLRGVEPHTYVDSELSIGAREIGRPPCAIADVIRLRLVFHQTCKSAWQLFKLLGSGIPIPTPLSLKIRSSSYHMPGMGFRNPSFAVAANIRNGTSGSCRQVERQAIESKTPNIIQQLKT